RCVTPYLQLDYSSISTSVISLFFCSIGMSPTDLYTLSLHDALPIFPGDTRSELAVPVRRGGAVLGAVLLEYPSPHRSGPDAGPLDRKSTRLNSSHVKNSYAVFCLKKKKIL